jgi:hemolysin activation/secretion protein
VPFFLDTLFLYTYPDSARHSQERGIHAQTTGPVPADPCRFISHPFFKQQRPGKSLRSFNQQFLVGQGKDIRGYSEGAYRGDHLLAAQGEYRWNFYGKWGAVGFLGLATVFESLNEGNDDKLLPGVGAGLRYTVFPDNHMNVGLDIATGTDDF